VSLPSFCVMPQAEFAIGTISNDWQWKSHLPLRETPIYINLFLRLAELPKQQYQARAREWYSGVT